MRRVVRQTASCALSFVFPTAAQAVRGIDDVDRALPASKANPWAAKGIPTHYVFGAYHTRKRADADWDRQSRTDESADVMVKFGDGPEELVFGRATSYPPVWQSGRAKTAFPEVLPRSGDGPKDRPHDVNRHSCVRIIEATPARAVVHWRSMPQMPKEVGPGKLPDQTQMADEYFVVYRDRTVVRAVLAGRPHYEEWREAAPGRLFRYAPSDKGLEEEPAEAGDTDLMLAAMGFDRAEPAFEPAPIRPLPKSFPKPIVELAFDQIDGRQNRTLSHPEVTSHELEAKMLARMFVACLLLVSCCGWSAPAAGQNRPALIPKPVHVTFAAGQFAITPATKILYGKGDVRLADAAEYLAGRLSQAFDRKIAAEPGDATEPPAGAVLLTTAGADAALGDEGYALAITEQGVAIRAPKAAGAFYGAITLLQLAPPEAFRGQALVEGQLGGKATVAAPRPCDEPNPSAAKPAASLAVPCATVIDKPRFAWRGLLIDPARHFWTIDELKQYADYMALHKLNSLQIHLTDHENWCAEVMKYPKLTPEKERSAVNPDNVAKQTYHKLARHYYTRVELKSLVEFAGKRFVNVVPEFEMPGHSGAFLRGCPECGCTVGGKQVGGGEVCPGNEKTYRVLQEIMDEMLDVFPSRYVHIGADECSKRNWGKCSECGKRMAAEGLADATQLHGYFVRRMSEYLQKKGRTLVGWDEILESGAKPGAIGMYWRSGRADKLVQSAVQNGQYLVLTPTNHCYFDYVQSPEKQSEPQGLGAAVITLRRAYELDPLPDYIQQAGPKLVLGVQANLWGERMKTFPHVLYMTYPRACALCEVAWSPAGQREYGEFYARLQTHLKRLDAAGIKYRAPTAVDWPE